MKTVATYFICDRISYNQASTHTKSNLGFYQKWIAGLIHYHIPHCASFRTGKSGFCSSFLPTLSKPRVGDMAPLNGHGFVIMVCSELGLHRELANSVLSQFGVI